MSATPGTSTNPFEILGLDRTASFDDVKLAYRRLAREHHPDANPDDPDALERFTTLRRAYDRLKIFYQTLDEAGPVAPPSAPEPARTRSSFATTRTPAAPSPIAATLQAAARREAAAETTMPGAVSREYVAEPTVPGTGSREHMAEPTVPGTGPRRAFRRTGPVRQSGDIALRQSGEIAARQSGDLRGAAPPAQPARLVATRLPAPRQVGGGHQAMRGEIVMGHLTMDPNPAPQMVYALVGLRASDAVAFPRVPLNLCLVLDHSSSMLRGGKVERLKETVRGIIHQLDEQDFLSIVSFGDRAEVLLPAQPLTNKAMVNGAIDAMRCRGGTEISRGLAAGISELSRNASRALSHLILLTDGQTYGDEMICLERAEEAAAMSVGITAYGLGADWNSTLLDGIAGPTGGHSDYIESAEAMARAFNERVASLQSTTLRNVMFSASTREGCVLQRTTLVSPMLRLLETPDEPGAPPILLGDMSGNTDYKLLCEFAVTAPRPARIALAELTLHYDVPGLQREGETLAVPITATVSLDHDPKAPVDPRVTDALRNLTAHRLQQQAWTEINGGNVAKGTGLLKRAAEHLEIAGHAELAEVAAAEAARVEGGDSASDENIKRIIYGTRKLG